MKTKFLTTCTIALLACTFFSCNHSINKEDAQILIRAKVPKCVCVIQCENTLDYACVDSTYHIRFFRAYDRGVSEIK